MEEKKLYEQKYKAQLDVLKADVAKLKAKSAEAEADAKLLLSRQVQMLEQRLADAQKKLAELRGTSGEAWESVKAGAEASWEALKSGFREAAAKFRD